MGIDALIGMMSLERHSLFVEVTVGGRVTIQAMG